MSQTVAANAPKAQDSMLSRMLAVREFGSLAALILMVLIIAVSIPQFRQVENPDQRHPQFLLSSGLWPWG